MSLYGMKKDDLIALAKKFKEAREYLGLSIEDVCKMLGVQRGEVEYLERFAVLEEDHGNNL